MARGIHINFQKLIDDLDWSEYPDWSPHDVAVRIAWYGMEKYSIAKKDEGWGDYVFKNADGENWSYWDKVYYDYFDYYYGWTERERYYVDYETIY